MTRFLSKVFAALFMMALMTTGGYAGPVADSYLSPSYGIQMTGASQVGRLGGLEAVDSTTMTQSMWIFGSTFPQVAGYVDSVGQTSVVTSSNRPGVGCEWSAGISPFECLVLLDNSVGYPVQWNINNSAGTSGLDYVLSSAGLTTAGWKQGQWNHVFVTLDATGRVGAIYFNGVKSATFTGTDIPVGVVKWGLSSPGGFGIGSRNTSGAITGGFADHYLSTDLAYCTSSSPVTIQGVSYACSGAGVVPAAFLAKFIDPVTKLAVNLGPDCKKPTRNTVSIVVCQTGSGPDMVSNRGYGGGFSLMDSTNQAYNTINLSAIGANPFWYGPGMTPISATSNPLHRAILKWKNTVRAYPAGCTNTCFVFNANEQPVALGDFLLAFMNLPDQGASGFGVMTCPTGWSQPTNSTTSNYNYNSYSGGQPILCWKFAAAGDLTTSTTWQISWTIANGGGGGTNSLTLMNFGQSVIGVDTSAIGHATGPRTSSGSTDSTSKTTTIANTTLISFMAQYSNNNVMTGLPAGSTLLLQHGINCGGAGGNGGGITITAHYNLPVGSTVNKVFPFIDPRGVYPGGNAGFCTRGTDGGDGWGIPLVPN